MNVKELRPIIIGGGNLGGAVARGLFRAGVRPVVVQHRGAKFDALAGDGVETVATLAEAAPRAAVPFHRAETVAGRKLLRGKRGAAGRARAGFLRGAGQP